MKLLASLTSPYARKIRIILAEKALPFELVIDSPWEANTRVPELNPLGKVPAVRVGDTLVTEQGAIYLYLADLFAGALVSQTKFEHHSTLLQAFVVLNSAADHVGVGHDNLLTAKTADARGLQADVLDRTGQRADDDEITHLKRLVDGNRQRGEHVAENVLHRQRHRDRARPRAHVDDPRCFRPAATE